MYCATWHRGIELGHELCVWRTQGHNIVTMIRRPWSRLPEGLKSVAAFCHDETTGALRNARHFIPRRNVELKLVEFANRGRSGPIDLVAAEKVLVDGTWDNPNFWTRLALGIDALGLSRASFKGIIGEFSRANVLRTFARFGIEEIFDQQAIRASVTDHTGTARGLIKHSQAPDDILNWRLPGGVPASLLYDSLLKWLCRGYADFDDPRFEGFVVKALTEIETSRRVIEAADATLLLTSHSIGVTYGSLVYFALERGMDVLCVYGDFGSQRFIRFTDIDQLMTESHVPELDEFVSHDKDKRQKLRDLGRQHLAHRLSGQTNDIAARQAYVVNNTNVDRASIQTHFGWKADKPIVAVYAQNWFDYPRYLGLASFRDFYDWICVTLNAAKNNRDVNWLFKAHPCDRLYKIAPTDKLQSIVERNAQDNIGFVPMDWNGRSLMASIDGAITCTGSVGFEFAALGKPVLLAESGWYGHLGMGVTATSREHYADLLGTEWWRMYDRDSMSARAEEFIGWYYCLPDWQKGCLMQDDSVGQSMYQGLEAFIATNADILDTESRTIREWYRSREFRYHVYKIKNAESYQLGNVV